MKNKIDATANTVTKEATAVFPSQLKLPIINFMTDDNKSVD